MLLHHPLAHCELAVQLTPLPDRHAEFVQILTDVLTQLPGAVQVLQSTGTDIPKTLGAEQDSPEGQTLPHAPQLLASLLKLVQVLLQTV